MDIKQIRNNIINTVSDKSPEILIGLGLAGMLTSTVMAVKATPKALQIIEEEENYNNCELTKLEKAKLTWKCYAPAAIGYCASAACIIGANSVHAKRNAVLAGAYKISESALLEYRDKVKEVLGEEEEGNIRASIAKDRVRKDEQRDSIVVTGKGDVLCYDMYSGRYFKSDMDVIKKITNDMNYKLMNNNMLSLNEFYYEMGLDPVVTGDDFGWNVDDGLIQIYFTSTITESGELCLTFHFDNLPKIHFDRIG